MRGVLPATLLLTAAGLAGCLGLDDNGELPDVGALVPDDWALRALEVDPDHKHEDPAQHANLSTPNFKVVGWDPLITDVHGVSTGASYCGDVATSGDKKYAVVQSLTSEVAFTITDITDPAAPEKVGEFVMPRQSSRDVATPDDGSFVVVASSQVLPSLPVPSHTGLDGAVGSLLGAPERAVQPWSFRNACGETTISGHEELIWGPSAILVDTSDPTQPVFADSALQPGIGVHSIFADQIDGTYYVVASTTNLAHQASYFTFYTVDDTPAGLRLVPYGAYTAQYTGPDLADSGLGLLNGHVDAWVHKHPGDGQTYAYLADWDGGLIILRLDGPGRLTPVSVWNNHGVTDALDVLGAYGFSDGTGQVHSAHPIDELWNDRHYTFIGQELLQAPPGLTTGWVIMLDTTDPADPTAVAWWTLPYEVEWGPDSDTGLIFSTHYLGVVNRTLFIAMYHGGVWAIGTDFEASENLPSLGVFLPTNVSPEPGHKTYRQYADWAPLVMEALPTEDGRIVTFDGQSGVYVVEFDPEMPIPIPEPWSTGLTL